LDIPEPIIPCLHDDIRGDGIGMRGSNSHIFPHNQLAILGFREDRQSIIHPVLEKIIVTSRRIGSKPLLSY
jgi:hypothetical protein